MQKVNVRVPFKNLTAGSSQRNYAVKSLYFQAEMPSSNLLQFLYLPYRNLKAIVYILFSLSVYL